MTNPNSAYVDWKHWDSNQFGTFDRLDAAYFEAETAIRENSGAVVLEIGFGNGSFMGWAKNLDCEILGVETNAELVARACSLLGGTRAFNSLHHPVLDEFQGRFTHVVAFDVIEHVEAAALPALLDRIRELLAINGRFITRFPNGDSPFGRVSQHGDPTHVHTIGRQKLEYFAKNSGLEVIEMRAPMLPERGVGTRRAVKRRMIKVGRAVFERLISVLYFGGRRIPMDINYVAVLGRTR